MASDPRAQRPHTTETAPRPRPGFFERLAWLADDASLSEAERQSRQVDALGKEVDRLAKRVTAQEHHLNRLELVLATLVARDEPVPDDDAPPARRTA